MMKKFPALFLLAITVASPVAFTGCQTPSAKQGEEMALAGQTTFTLPIPIEGLSDAAIKRSIVAALVSREWTVSRDEDELVVGTLDHRGINAKVMFTWDEDSITIEDDSHKEDGEAFVPIRWINNLKKDIQKFLVSTSA